MAAFHQIWCKIAFCRKDLVDDCRDSYYSNAPVGPTANKGINENTKKINKQKPKKTRKAHCPQYSPFMTHRGILFGSYVAQNYPSQIAGIVLRTRLYKHANDKGIDSSWSEY
jgi:hypothetical protein